MARFPSLLISRDGLSAEGSFAEAQAAYIDPDPDAVEKLDGLLAATNTGVVAHFYMDAELQGALYACAWSQIHVSDSLLMADRGVRMAEEGIGNLVVLGVDFMSENVRAMVSAGGRGDVPVYRVATDEIGCSLAEAAESRHYLAYLEQAAAKGRALHVVYINTSLRTKARAHHKVPTITCTSSNVVRTVLQAFAQESDIDVYFGPDTYMGHNLAVLFERLAEMDDGVIQQLHPAHDQASVRALRDRFHYFKQGNCIVHHMFGADVVAQVRAEHPDAMVTAHLEVPGEMFALGLEAQHEGRGVVGSTSNILGYIDEQLVAAIEQSSEARLPFVLGTEAGMVTAIVRKVRERLAAVPEGQAAPTVEIIFPVASEAVATTGDESLPIVPGVQGGEGCTIAGGCATCPYMKMNSFDALIDLLEQVRDAEDPATLRAFHPKAYTELIDGRTMADLGSEPILHMRHFQQTGELPPALMNAIRGQAATG